MRRTSFIGPLILILLGVLFLWSNLSNEFALLDVLALHWPWILVGWGVIRLGELAFWKQRQQPLPAQGVSGGEWFLVILICLMGSGLYGSRNVIGDFAGFPLRSQSVKLFGESFDFSIADQRVAAGKNSRLLVENLRGEVIVTAEDTDEVTVSGRESIRAVTEADARENWESRQVTVERQGDRVIVRTNQEGMAGDRQARAYLQIRVPRDCSLEARGRNVNYEVNGLGGKVELQSDEGDARLSTLGDAAHIRIARSSRIRLRDVAGQVEVISGRGDNLEVDSVRGPVTINGAFSGNIQLRQLFSSVRVEDRRLDFRASAIPGEVVANRGDFVGKGITGPVRISSESKDVSLEQFTGKLELTLERRDARIRQEGPQIWPVEVTVRRGKVTLEVPKTGNFLLDGRARKGEIANRTGREFIEELDAGGSRIRGGTPGAPLLQVNAERIELEAIATSAASP